jgi:hypothetical protein
MSTRAHIIVVIGALAAFLFILRLVAVRQLRSKYALLWLAVGLALLVLATFPGALDEIADWLGIAYAPTALVTVALAVLGAIVVHLTWELSRLEMRSRTLAEDLALLRAVVAEHLDTTSVGPARDVDASGLT